MYFAILFGEKRKYMLVKFNVKAERETFVNHSNFMEINTAQVRKYIDSKVFHLCNGNNRVVYDNNGVRIGRIDSLYKCVSKQKVDHPEDSPIPCLPKVRRKNIVNATTAHQYNAKL